VEELTLDFSNAAPENKGRKRVIYQVRIRIIVVHRQAVVQLFSGKFCRI